MEKNLNAIADSVLESISRNLPDLGSSRALLAASILSACTGGASIPVKDLDQETPEYSYNDTTPEGDADTDTDADTDADSDTDADTDTQSTGETGDSGDTATTLPSVDSDGDLFADFYETEQGTDPLSAISKPNLAVRVMGNRSVLGVLDADTPIYTEFAPAHDYTQTTEVLLQPGVPALIGLEVELDKGALALQYDESAYLGSIDLEYCGSQPGLWTPDAAACAPLAGEFTEEADATQLTDWTTLDTVYDSTSFGRWFQHNEAFPANDFEYPAVALEIQ